MVKISVLGVSKNSFYRSLHVPGVELVLYDKERDMRSFKFDSPVIAHAPCAQWSRLRKFARVNEDEKSLAFFALKAVEVCGGIFEHPHGSMFMRDYIGYDNCYRVNLHQFGFPALKPTLLYFNKVFPVKEPLNFNAVTHKLSNVRYSSRSKTPIEFNKWLIDCIIASGRCEWFK